MKKIFLLSAIITLFTFPGCDFSFGGDGVVSLGGAHSEGSAREPIDLTGTFPVAYHGTVSLYAGSYYRVNVTSGYKYTVTVTGMSDNVDLGIFSDSEFTYSIGSSSLWGTADESETVIAGGNTLYIFIGGFNTRGGSSYDLTVAETVFTNPNEGTQANPIDISGPFPVSYSGTVNSDGSSYYMLSVTAGNYYVISSTGFSAESILRVYNNSNFTNAACTSYNTSIFSENCAMVASGGTLYIEVEDYYTSDGSSFELGISEYDTAPVNEGTAASSVNISGAFPVAYTGSVAASGDSYYRVNVTAGDYYSIGATGISDDMSLSVYSDSGYSNQLCYSSYFGTTDPNCDVVASGSTLYIRVSDFNTSIGSYFTLSIVDNGFAPASEGSVASPVDISGAFPVSYSGSVAASGTSYYIVNVTSGNVFRISITGMTNETSLYVYSGSGYTGSVCSSFNSGLTDESCTGIATGSILYIKVADDNTTVGSYYTLNVSDNGPAPVSEGSVTSPVDISGTFPSNYSGSVATSGFSYYRVPVTDGNTYFIGVSGLSDSVSLNVYNDSNYSVQVCSSNNSGISDESCMADATGISYLYIRIFCYGSVGTNASVDILDAGSAAAYYVFETVGTGAGTVDTVLWLYESDGASPVNGCVASDDQGGAGSYSKILCYKNFFLSGNTYYLKVVPYGGSGSGSYRMTWRDNQSEAATCTDSVSNPDTGSGLDAADNGDDLIGGAVTIDPGCSNGLDRMLKSGSDSSDWFKFIAP